MADTRRHPAGAAHQVVVERIASVHRTAALIESRVLMALLNEERFFNNAQLAEATAKALADYDRGLHLDLAGLRAGHTAAEDQAASELTTALDLALVDIDAVAGAALKACDAYPKTPAQIKEIAERAERQTIRNANPVPSAVAAGACVESSAYLAYRQERKLDDLYDRLAADAAERRIRGDWGRLLKMHNGARFNLIKPLASEREANETALNAQRVLLEMAVRAEASIVKGVEHVDFSGDARVVPSRSLSHAVSSCLPVSVLYDTIPALGTFEGLGASEPAVYCKHCALCFGDATVTTASILAKRASVRAAGEKAILVRQCPENTAVRCCDHVVMGRVYPGFELAQMRARHDACVVADETAKMERMRADIEDTLVRSAKEEIMRLEVRESLPAEYREALAGAAASKEELDREKVSARNKLNYKKRKLAALFKQQDEKKTRTELGAGR